MHALERRNIMTFLEYTNKAIAGAKDRPGLFGRLNEIVTASFAENAKDYDVDGENVRALRLLFEEEKGAESTLQGLLHSSDKDVKEAAEELTKSPSFVFYWGDHTEDALTLSNHISFGRSIMYDGKDVFFTSSTLIFDESGEHVIFSKEKRIPEFHLNLTSHKYANAVFRNVRWAE